MNTQTNYIYIGSYMPSERLFIRVGVFFWISNEDNVWMAAFLGCTQICLLCLIHSRYIIMIVIIAVMIAVTGTVMPTDITAATDEDKPN